MFIEIDHRAVYAYTGGKTFDPTQPVAVFIHGAQHDHSVWTLQNRYFAHHGFATLAVDLPGHGRSAGPAATSIHALANWLAALLDTLRIDAALIAGHSMGSLIGLDFAGRYPLRVRALALVGVAVPMSVSDTLIDAALHRESEAIALINQWSHAIPAPASAISAGFWLQGSNQRLMERIAMQGDQHLLHTDLVACNLYTQGLERAMQLRCPVQLVRGNKDLMTPVRATHALIEQLTTAGIETEVVTLDAGHALMSEAPNATLDALFRFASRTTPAQQQLKH